MPVLGALMVNLFAGLASFFSGFLAAKAAILVAALAASALALTTLTVAITAGLATITATLPDHPMVATGLYFAIPENGPAVMAFCLLVDASIAVYRLAMDKVRMGVSVA